MPKGPALGDPERTTWPNFCGIISAFRRFGPKDGTGFCAARFKLEDDGRQVRRLKANLLARTAVALDIETSKDTRELPPTLDELAKRLKARGWAAALWTSHNHRPPNDIRCRVVLPLSEEIDHELPAPEIIGDVLGVSDVLDRSKLGAASYFYLPSCSGDDTADLHQEIVIAGALIDAEWLIERATALLKAREAEKERQVAEAHAAAEARRQERIAAGFALDDTLIEKIRACLPSLEQILLSHNYDSIGIGSYKKFRHPNSTSGSYGANIKEIKGVERVYSFNGADPLHNEKHALDAFEVVSILEFGGDRNRALRELGEQFGLIQTDDRKAERTETARLAFNLLRSSLPSADVLARLHEHNKQRPDPLPPEVVRATAIWCAQHTEQQRHAPR
jgi:hypothetical protein